MAFMNFVADFWRKRTLLTQLSAAECRKRVLAHTSRPEAFGLRKAARPLFGEQSGDTIVLQKRWLGVFASPVRLRGQLRETGGSTTVECLIGARLPRLIVLALLVGYVAWGVLLVGRSVLWLHGEGRLELVDAIIAALGMVTFSAIGIGLVAYTRRVSRREGDALFDALSAMLDGRSAPQAGNKS
jgi:hypothetical protein